MKQRIIIDLENARLWGMFLLPSIGLDCTLLFTNQLFNDRVEKFAMAGLVLMWILFVFYMRNESLRKANEKISEL